jgi:anhydro-N-acetylmuramic acid kinase
MLVMGLISGTSADGVEVALVRVDGVAPELKVKLVGHVSVGMRAEVRQEILRVAEGAEVTAGEISQLNFALGEMFADAALAACKKLRVPIGKVELIGSHGQTIFHQGAPVKFLGKPTTSTLQIGEPAVIAARTGVTTIGDFRVADMAVGGQGAPLVPFADRVLYGDSKIGRVSLNLGGIANVTVLPKRGKKELTQRTQRKAHRARGEDQSEAPVFAFDTGPANMLIDGLVAHFTRGKKRYDAGGKLAMQGRSIDGLLNELLVDPYFYKVPPKSTGREYYGEAYLKRVLDIGKSHKARPNDLIRAATELTVTSVVAALRMFVFPQVEIEELIVSGGGAKNRTIMMLLEKMLASDGVRVMTSERFGVPEEAKEALAFALMAYETFHGRPSNVPSATGAEREVVLGKICIGRTK